MTDRQDRPDRTAPALANEPTDSTEPNEPAEPMDRMEPADPIDKIDPLEPMDRIDPLEPMDRIDPAEPSVCSDLLPFPMSPFSQQPPDARQARPGGRPNARG
jgi:hypothetical protein